MTGPVWVPAAPRVAQEPQPPSMWLLSGRRGLNESSALILLEVEPAGL